MIDLKLLTAVLPVVFVEQQQCGARHYHKEASNCGLCNCEPFEPIKPL